MTLRRFSIATSGLAALIVLAAAGAVVHAAEAACVRGDLVPVRLTCECQREPTGLVEAKPPLSWIVESAERGDVQTAWQILAATKTELLEPGLADLWDLGRMTMAETLGVVYDGKTLQEWPGLAKRLLDGNAESDGQGSPVIPSSLSTVPI